MNEEDRRKLDEVIELLKGFHLETKGIRRHVASTADITEDVLKTILNMVQEIRNRK